MIEQIGAADRDVEQGAFAGGLIVRHRGFVEMTEVVEFVTVHRSSSQRFGPIHGCGGCGSHGARGIQVAVRLLRGGDQRDVASQ
jgi:hypothetical protein